MRYNLSPYTVLAFLLSFFSDGLFYWTLPYEDVTLPNTLITPELFVIVICGILLQSLTEISLKNNLNLMAAVIPAVVLSRVIFEGLSDPTSHNLWPFELIIAVIAGYAVALHQF